MMMNSNVNNDLIAREKVPFIFGSRARFSVGRIVRWWRALRLVIAISRRRWEVRVIRTHTSLI